MNEMTIEASSAFYAELKSAGKLKDHRAVAYRCPKRCLLVDVLTTPQGLIIHTPAYKLSPDLNEELSNEPGRAANTIDGNRKWKGHTFPISLAVNITCTCDHMRHLLDVSTIQADTAARRGEVVLIS